MNNYYDYSLFFLQSIAETALHKRNITSHLFILAQEMLKLGKKCWKFDVYGSRLFPAKYTLSFLFCRFENLRERRKKYRFDFCNE